MHTGKAGAAAHDAECLSSRPAKYAADADMIGRCAAEAESAFDTLNIAREKISRIRTDIQYAGSETAFVSGVDLWLETPGCQGSVVITFGGSCQYTGTFERGDCRLADLMR
jgi:hypothetical protein